MVIRYEVDEKLPDTIVCANVRWRKFEERGIRKRKVNAYTHEPEIETDRKRGELNRGRKGKGQDRREKGQKGEGKERKGQGRKGQDRKGQGRSG